MESISIANQMLQDSTGYQTKMLWNPYQQQTRSYKILRDTRQKCYGIHINSKQDPTRFYGILDKNARECISIANKILQDPKRSCKILQDPTRSYKILRDTRQKCFGIHINSKQDRTRFYGILDKYAMESILIANKILQDSTGYQTNMLWNPYQQQTRSYRILRDTRQICYGIHINSKQDPTRFYGILQDPTRFYGIPDKYALESISIANKIRQDPTRFYVILDKNAMESISIANKIQDPKRSCNPTRYKILQDPKRSCKILQDPTRSYKILRDTRQKCYGIHINSKQDPTRFYGILDKHAMESISIANKILQDSSRYQTKMLWNPYQQQTRSYKILKDPSRSYKILQDPTRFYGILDKNAMKSISIANKILQDSPGYQTKMLWNPYQQQTRSYKILKDPARSYKILQDPTRFYGILDKNALEYISIANKILQDSTGYYTKMLWNPYQQQTRSYKFLRDTRQKCYGIHINSKQDPSRS